VLAGLNHKMGYRGTTNTLLNFGEGRHRPAGAAGAVGHLVGEPNRGLACMFHMMNEARIGVGLGATMLGYTGYLHSLDYARNRPQGRHPAAKDPQAPQVPIVEHADVRRMLLAQKAYVEGALALNLYCARLVDEQKTGTDESARDAAGMLLDLLTPIAKSWPSQWCLEANSLAIQIHGGYGYTRDYPVEQFYRDNRLNPIHEGTHGIQGLDLLGRKVVQGGGKALQLLGREIERACKEAQGSRETVRLAGALGEAAARIALTTEKLHTSGNLDRTLANASLYLEAFGHVVLAWIWLKQATLAARQIEAGTSEAAFYRGKLKAAEWFFRWELPKTVHWCELLSALDTTTLDMQNDWF
jgi:Acetyl-CoA dehydrogenase C-terminal like/Acyl-CoA dehydrogenase, C-terminal domain